MADLFLLHPRTSLGFIFRLSLRRVLLQQCLSLQTQRADLGPQRLWSISIRSQRSGPEPCGYHLRSSIGHRDQTARPSAISCTWRTEGRTRRTQAGRCILKMFSGFCRRIGWVSLTFAVKDIDWWDRLRGFRRRVFRCGDYCWQLVSFLVWCHRQRDRRIYEKRCGWFDPTTGGPAQ